MRDAHPHWNELSDPLLGAIESRTMARLQFLGAAAIAIGIVVIAVFVVL
ncbi:MAG TPA: hypothetical protein VKS78_11225 [Roseiarcus sp.]|nr:hypothetical protein [Roseiarcus sp.]